jgi:hypothetical protein
LRRTVVRPFAVSNEETAAVRVPRRAAL